MTHTSYLTEKINTAISQGRKAIIPYLPAGYPNKSRFWKEIQGLDESGADIIEIGVPFSDPVADGPVVEKASLKCLEHGVTLSLILDELKTHRKSLQAGIVLMGYYNPFLQYGLEKFARNASDAGVNGVIVPDLPLEEMDTFRGLLEARNIDLIALIGLNTSAERMKKYEEFSRGFVYYVSVLGTTGQRKDLPPELMEGLSLAKSIFSTPLALGFGIQHKDQLETFQDHIDAVVIGSALISHLDQDGTVQEFMQRFTS